jgi:O-antigen/teichoic acid export membrane protein
MARFIGPAISLFLLPIMLKELGKELFGLWVILNTISIAGILGFLDFNMPASIAKFAAEDLVKNDTKQINNLFSSGLIIFIFLGTFISITVIALARPLLINLLKIKPSMLSLGLSVIQIFAFQNFFEFFMQPYIALLQAKQRFDLQQYLNIACLILSYGFMITVLLLHFSIFALAVINLFKTLGLFLGYVFIAYRILPGLKFQIKAVCFSQISRIFRFSAILMGFRIVGIVSRQANKFIIAFFRNVTSVGELSILERIYEVPAVFGSLISGVIMPAASSVHASKDWEKLGDMYIRGTKYTVFASTLVSICSIVLLKPLLIIWLGPEYSFLAFFGQLMLATLFFDALISPGQNMSVGVGKPVPILKLTVFAMLINVIVTIFMVSKQGLMGVVWGLASGSIVGSLTQFVVISRTMHVPLKEIFWNSVVIPFPGIAIGGMCAFFLSIIWPPHSLIGIFIIAATAVSVGIFVFNFTGLDEREKKFVHKLILENSFRISHLFAAVK